MFSCQPRFFEQGTGRPFWGNNIFDSAALDAHTFPRRKPKKGKRVTLILGIICRDAIVLAADSQTTKGSAKQLGANKISVAEFGNGKAAVAESGSASCYQMQQYTFFRTWPEEGKLKMN
jgi:hypothetical protein